MVTLPKFRIGRKERRAHLNFQHDGETTSGFGFCQPTVCKLIHPNSKISLGTRSFTRLSALPCPTFGRIEVKHHTTFVPINDVFPAFNFFQSQQVVASALRSYIPQSTDYITAGFIWDLIVSRFLKPLDFGASSAADINQIPFRLGFWVKRKDIDPQEDHIRAQGHDPNEYVNPFTDEFYSNPIVNGNVYNYINLNRLNLYTKLMEFLEDSNLFMLENNPVFLPHISSPAYQWVLDNQFEHFDGTYPDGENPTDYYNIIPDAYFAAGSDLSATWLSDLKYSAESSVRNILNDTYGAGSRFQFGAMSLENADYVFPFTALSDPSISYTAYGEQDEDHVPTEPTSRTVRPIITIHLTNYGKKLIGKILNPLHIYFGNPEKKIELPKLYAVYKSWYDKYNPGRSSQWKDTNCYKLIHSYYDHGDTVQTILEDSSDYADMDEYALLMCKFFDDLVNMYYSLPLDNITAATPDPIIGEINSTTSISLYNNRGSETVGQDSDEPYGQIDSGNSTMGGLLVKYLERLYPLANKNNSFGARVDAYMRAHGLGSGIPETNVLGDDSYLCNISDVVGSVNNDSTLLGELAGKGIGGNVDQDGKVKILHFENKDFGYLIQLLCVVPLGGYVQGNDKSHISRYDFLQPEFDSLGKEPLPYDEVFGRYYFLRQTKNETFGFLPRYFTDKIINNTSAGDFSLRSAQKQFLPYSLNRLFSEADIYQVDGKLMRDSRTSLSPDEYLRYIGKDFDLGNYDRIFYDTTGLTDNFIIHMIHDLDVWSPVKPVRDSWDTFDDETDDGSVDISGV